MTKTELENYIKARVYANGTKSITGTGLQQALLAIVDELYLTTTTTTTTPEPGSTTTTLEPQ